MTASVDGNTVTIPNQITDELMISSERTINGDILTINIMVADEDGSDSENCSVVCTKN